MVTDEKVLDTLKQIEDPEIGLNIVDLGLIYEVILKDGGGVHVKMTLTSPGCPVGPQILNGSRMVLDALEEVDKVDIQLVWDPPWSPERINPEYREALGF